MLTNSKNRLKSGLSQATHFENDQQPLIKKKRNISNAGAILLLHFGGYSHKGLKAENQDAFAAYTPKNSSEMQIKGAVASLADGVSSVKNAAKASQLSVTQFIQEYYSTSDTWSTKKSASKVLNSLNQWLYSQPHMISNSKTYDKNQQWLTTFSSLIFKSSTGYIFHIGDSRISQYKNNKIESITRDHNQKQVGQHVILTRALGAEHHLKVDFHKIELNQDDIYILTSDGVHDFISNKELILQLANLPRSPSNKDLEQASETITKIAIENGSNDNVSCLLVYVEETPNKSVNEIEREILSKTIPPSLSLGTKLDNYQVIKTLHASIRSHLYLVEDLNNKSKKVIKIPSINFAEDTVYLQGFIREAWIGERVNHSNIMKIIKKNNESQFLYHVCEYIEGQTLSAWMHDNPQPSIAQVRDIISQLVSALRMFQRLDIIHRDLKPDNVMIDKFGQIKLIDYGTALVASLEEDCNLIKEDVPQGSLNYIAPETLLFMTSNNMSDLFSLGVICYEMLCGELPFKPMKTTCITQTHYSDWQYRSIKLFRPKLPLWLDLTLMRCTAPDPAIRFQAYSELLTDLTTPNLVALDEYKKQPFLQRNPVKFWQNTSILLLVILIYLLINTL